jgi:hypothetical protein
VKERGYQQNEQERRKERQNKGERKKKKRVGNDPMVID